MVACCTEIKLVFVKALTFMYRRGSTDTQWSLFEHIVYLFNILLRFPYLYLKIGQPVRCMCLPRTLECKISLYNNDIYLTIII